MLWAIFLSLMFAQSLSVQKPVSPDTPAPNAPIWSKKGISFPLSCPPFTSCHPLRITSPNRRNTVQVNYETIGGDIEAATLKLSVTGRYAGYLSTSGDLVEEEIVWSPDSRCFFINGNYNGYVDEIASVYCIDQPNFALAHIMRYVEEDIVHSFPPCRAAYLSEKQCTQMVADPSSYLAVLALDWTHGSSEMVVMAEVPCGSMWGGIMCQVLGYEIAVPSGKILRRMAPKELEGRWQHSMAWKFRIPDPPEYKKN